MAVLFRKKNPSALRQLAWLRTALGQRKEALAAWQKLSEANALTAADAQDYGLLAGVEGEWALANLIIDQFRAGNHARARRSRFGRLPRSKLVGTACRSGLKLQPRSAVSGSMRLF